MSKKLSLRIVSRLALATAIWAMGSMDVVAQSELAPTTTPADNTTEASSASQDPFGGYGSYLDRSYLDGDVSTLSPSQSRGQAAPGVTTIRSTAPISPAPVVAHTNSSLSVADLLFLTNAMHMGKKNAKKLAAEVNMLQTSLTNTQNSWDYTQSLVGDTQNKISENSAQISQTNTHLGTISSALTGDQSNVNADIINVKQAGQQLQFDNAEAQLFQGFGLGGAVLNFGGVNQTLATDATTLNATASALAQAKVQQTADSNQKTSLQSNLTHLQNTAGDLQGQLTGEQSDLQTLAAQNTALLYKLMLNTLAHNKVNAAAQGIMPSFKEYVIAVNMLKQKQDDYAQLNRNLATITTQLKSVHHLVVSDTDTLTSDRQAQTAVEKSLGMDPSQVATAQHNLDSAKNDRDMIKHLSKKMLNKDGTLNTNDFDTLVKTLTAHKQTMDTLDEYTIQLNQNVAKMKAAATAASDKLAADNKENASLQIKIAADKATKEADAKKEADLKKEHDATQTDIGNARTARDANIQKAADGLNNLILDYVTTSLSGSPKEVVSGLAARVQKVVSDAIASTSARSVTFENTIEKNPKIYEPLIAQALQTMETLHSIKVSGKGSASAKKAWRAAMKNTMEGLEDKIKTELGSPIVGNFPGDGTPAHSGAKGKSKRSDPVVGNFTGDGTPQAEDKTLDAGKSDAGKSGGEKSDAGKSGGEKSDAGKSDAGKSGTGKSDAGKSDAGKSEAGHAKDVAGHAKAAPRIEKATPRTEKAAPRTAEHLTKDVVKQAAAKK